MLLLTVTNNQRRQDMETVIKMIQYYGYVLHEVGVE